MEYTNRSVVAALRAALTLVLVSTTLAAIATHRAEAQYNGNLPKSLKPSLEQRLALYTSAQAEGRWDLVSSLLGRYRRSGVAVVYTPEHKQCLISQMQSVAPLIAFKFETYSYSTQILSTPAAKRWWYLEGEGVYRTKDGEKRGRTQLVGYRDNGQWFFTPLSLDDWWERSHLAEADLNADKTSRLVVDIPPNAPVEVVDLHVSVNPKYLSLRQLRFRVRNKTAKAVIGYGVKMGRMGDKCFSQLHGAPLKLEPFGISDEIASLDYSAYLYYCEGEHKERLVIDVVNFADGTTWKDKRLAVRSANCSF